MSQNKKSTPTVSGSDPASIIIESRKTLDTNLVTTSSGIEEETQGITDATICTIEADEIQRRASRLYKMKTKRIDAEKIFLYVSRDSLPADEVNRFLKLCETMILSLGEESITDTDLEEIALIYRDRIYTDRQYKLFAQSDALDTSMVSQIEKLNKALEQRKMNLGARFIDKGKPRKDSSMGESFVDLFKYFTENQDTVAGIGKNKRKQIEDNKEKFTKVSEYMKQGTPHKIKKDSEEGG